MLYKYIIKDAMIALCFFCGAAIAFVGHLMLRRYILKHIPELDHVISDEEKDQFHNGIIESYEPSGYRRLLSILIPVGTILGLEAACASLCIKPMWEFLIGIIAIPPIMTAHYWMWRNELRHFVRRRLAERGYLICLKCGYDLHGQRDPRCPECGTEFDPSRFHIKKGALYCVDSWPRKHGSNNQQ